jgi:serine protease Do
VAHPRNSKTALVISGSGAKGAFGVGVLECISQNLPFGGVPMKGLLVSILMLVAMTTTGIPMLIASPNCTEKIPELFQRVSPSVVLVTAVTIDPFKVTNRVSSAIGSGFIISDDGLVVTNSHVVFGRQAITVTLDDGRKTEAKLLGADPILDLAVLRIPVPPEGHPKATLGDSDAVQIGEEVIAIGNPLGLEQTLTRGVISGINRILPESHMALMLPLIQTDAPINPGSSGGPLLNLCGKVIGINTSILSNAQNIGFAIPINIAKRAILDLVAHGRVIRPWIGINGKLIKKEFMEIINVPLVDGFLVETIEPGSPAQQAGLHEGWLPVTIAGIELLLGGDIITDINGQPLDDREKFEKLLASLKVGDKVYLTLFRKQKTLKVEFSIPERPILPADLRLSGSGTLLPMGDGFKEGFPLRR